MRGPLPGVDTFLAPLLYSFQMAREDLAKYTAGLTTEQIWATPHGFGSLGFHLRHIAGSTDRLMTYVTGGQLSKEVVESMQIYGRTDQELRSLTKAIEGPARPAASTKPKGMREHVTRTLLRLS